MFAINKPPMKIWPLVLLLLLPAALSFAGAADVIKVEVDKRPDGSYQFHVSVTHQDEGWQHYADKWDVVAPDGTLLGTRTLYHPHVNEQPFTRSLSGVRIPAGTPSVSLRAHDSVHGYGGKSIQVELP